jgi:hypothetical protein
MMHAKRILGIALCALLSFDAHALAAGRRRPAGHGKSSTQKSSTQKWSAPNREANPASNGSADGAPRSGGTASESKAADSRSPQRESARQESRIEFDERMLRGQSAAGVIYLFQRTPSEWKSIVEVPDSFRERTVNVLAPTEERK